MAFIFPPDGSLVGTIIGIDPGTNTMGLCMMDVNVHTLEIINVKAETFKSERYLDLNDDVVRTHGERVAKLLIHLRHLESVLEHYKPFVVCVENPFMNRLRPGAYGPLVECVATIRTAVLKYSKLIPFLGYEPAVVKKTVGCFATSGNKIDVTNAIANIAEITNIIDKDIIFMLDEHSVDSIAVAYTHLKNMRKVKS